MKLFSDDSNLFIIGDNLSKLFDTANDELTSLSTQLNANKLYKNYHKTNYILFIPKSKNRNINSYVGNNNLLFNGHVIDRVTFIKYLGIFIDDTLN